ncbi:helix-turn-helix domain-containing protein [Croceimicrobium hydrocarbonivorans]|uniref:Helix-turn-helix transcriptional regulator n=1 Tax=Croceimicrobium hydrocarbonivorans TaxID=2761580 RepID=A0A7H0VA75_9FLAO|nr:helix-turn-helix transcriptional regulator [Croceimicrobium hydrocarbonivorans]QNR22623.1 helix-turn-helix transcriptional regulator [Croceimicrobium hydrocarbonivorans]|tara:strand:+ start:1484 stop:1843 length:360 start_codon:yes stop_codon:yes gene_type:complete
MNAEEICKRIRNLRELRRINQAEIANHLGITQSSYAKMERGQTKISLDRFVEIVDYLDADPLFFFKEINSPSQKPNRPYRQNNQNRSQWEESLGYNLYVVAQQNEELMDLLEGLKPRSA